MSQPTHTSLSKILWKIFRFLLVMLWRAVIGFLRALFFPPKPSRVKVIAYWGKNERGLWELRIPAYSLKESFAQSR